MPPSPKTATVDAGLDLGGVEHRADPRRDAAAEQADLVERRVRADLRERDLGHDRVLREGRRAHVVVQRLAARARAGSCRRASAPCPGSRGSRRRGSSCPTGRTCTRDTRGCRAGSRGRRPRASGRPAPTASTTPAPSWPSTRERGPPDPRPRACTRPCGRPRSPPGARGTRPPSAPRDRSVDLERLSRLDRDGRFTFKDFPPELQRHDNNRGGRVLPNFDARRARQPGPVYTLWPMASPVESAPVEEVESGPTITNVIEILPDHVYENPTPLGPAVLRARRRALRGPGGAAGGGRLAASARPALDRDGARDQRALHHRPRRRARRALLEQAPQLRDRPGGDAALAARLRGLGLRPQPHPPRAHRARGDGLRLASRDARELPRDDARAALRAPREVVVVRRRRVLRLGHLVEEHDALRGAREDRAPT